MKIPIKEIFGPAVFLGSPRLIFEAISKVFTYLLKRDAEALHVEHAFAVSLSSRNRLLCLDETSRGLQDSTLMSPKSIFRQAIIQRASRVIIVHNHPSGLMKPSDDDCRMTEQLCRAGEILGIRIIDHIIVVDKKNPELISDVSTLEKTGYYYSFAEHNLI